jgi:hypothetical protein
LQGVEINGEGKILEIFSVFFKWRAHAIKWYVYKFSGIALNKFKFKKKLQPVQINSEGNKLELPFLSKRK